MAQTTGAMTGASATLEVNINSGGWTSIAGSAQSVDAVDISVVSGSAHTLEGDTAVITVGRQEETSLTVNCLYTEVVDEALKLVLASIKANQSCNVRWKIAGASGATFTTENGVVGSVSLPNADSSSGEPLMFSFTVVCGGISTTIA